MIDKGLTKTIFVVILAIGFIFIYGKVCFLRGALQERASKVCVGTHELDVYEETLEIAQLVCIDGLSIKSREEELCKAEVKRWKDNYFWIKRQQEETLNKLDDNI